jgi:RHS repeat-associated protein
MFIAFLLGACIPSAFTGPGLHKSVPSSLTATSADSAAPASVTSGSPDALIPEGNPTGAYQTSIPIQVPAYHELEPRLSLVYDSSRGNGLLGVGWSLSGYSVIQRLSPDRGVPTFTDSDAYFLDGQRLYSCLANSVSPSCRHPLAYGKAYFETVESFRRISHVITGANSDTWIVADTHGRKSEYQGTQWHQLPSPSGTHLATPFEWTLSAVSDPNGNRATYSPWPDRDVFGTVRAVYPGLVYYNSTEVHFYWEQRPDPIEYARGVDGVEAFQQLRYRLKAVAVWTAGSIVRVYELAYDDVRRVSTGRSFLSRVTLYGNDAIVNSAGNVTNATKPTNGTKPVSTQTLFAANNTGVVGDYASSWWPNDTKDVKSSWYTPVPPALSSDAPLPRPANRLYVTNTWGGQFWYESPLQWSSTFSEASLPADLVGDGHAGTVTAYSALVPFSNGLGSFKRASNLGTKVEINLEWGIYLQTIVQNGPSFIRNTTSTGLVWWQRESTDHPGWQDEAHELLAGDINGDSRDDAVIVTSSHGLGIGACLANFYVSRGDGALDKLPPVVLRDSEGTTLKCGPDRPRQHWFLRDVNDDGIADLVVLQDNDGALEVITFLLDGSGSIANTVVHTAPGTWSTVTLIGNSTLHTLPYYWLIDVNADGRSDLLRVNEVTADSSEYAQIQVALANGDGSFNFDGSDCNVEKHPTCTPTDVPWRPDDLLPFSGDQTSENNFPAQVGDFNGDGYADIVLIGSLAEGHLRPRVVVWTAFGDGTGKFNVAPQGGYNTQTLYGTLINTEQSKCDTATCGYENQYPNTWAVGDMNGDGADDLMVGGPLRREENPTNFVPEYDVHLLLSDRLGGYSVSTTRTDWLQSIGSSDEKEAWKAGHNDIFLADIDGNGAQDIVYTAARISDSSSCPQGTCAGALRFHAIPSAANASNPRRWLQGDINGDGRPDLVYVQPLPKGIRVHTFLSNCALGKDLSCGGMTKVSPPLLTDQPNLGIGGWRIGDVDGDGRADLLAVKPATSVIEPFAITGWRVVTLKSNGDGTWTDQCPAAMDARCQLPIALPHPASPVPGNTWPFQPKPMGEANWHALDVNGDGQTDLVRVENPSTDTSHMLAVTTAIMSGRGWSTSISYVNQPNLMATDVSGWQPADINGDGRIDLVHAVNSWNHGDAASLFQTLTRDRSIPFGWTFAPTSNAIRYGFSDTRSWRIARVNDDSIADLLHLTIDPAGKITIDALVGVGNGHFYERVATSPDGDVGDVSLLSDLRNWLSADVNGDGRTDLVHPAIQGHPMVNGGTVKLTTITPIPDPALPYAAWRVTTKPAGTVGDDGDWRSADIQGTGQDGLLLIPHQADTGVVAFPSQSPPDRVTSVTDPLGGHQTVRYEPATGSALRLPGSNCAAPLGPSPIPVGVAANLVDSILRDDGRGNTTLTAFSYSCPKWSLPERSLLGWERVDAHHPAAQNRPGYWTTITYWLQPGLAQPIAVVRLTDNKQTQLASEQFRHDVYGRGPPYNPLILARTSRQCSDTGCGNSLTYYATYQYDEFGNMTGQSEGTGTGPPYRSTVTSYVPIGSGQRYLAALPSQSTVRDAAGHLVTQTKYCYDSLPDCTGEPTNGLLTEKRAWSDAKISPSTGQLGDWVIIRYDYYPDGNLRRITDPDNRTTTIASYDPILHMLPETVCNGASECTTTTWDTGLGVPASIRDANNATTTYHYDPLGRLERTVDANGGVTRQEYLDWGTPFSQRIRTIRDDGSSDGLWSDVYLDGLGRTYLQTTKAEPPFGTRQAETTYSDASTRPWTVSGWHTTGSPAVIDAYSYDAQGRPARLTHADNSSITWAYATTSDSTGTTAATVTTTDELKHQRITGYDAYGRLVFVTDPVGKTTRYQYDAADNLTGIQDPQNNTWTYGWDTVGHKLWADSPDAGRWTYTYTDGGLLKTQTDARHITTGYGYDKAGRLSSTSLPDGTGATWNYSEPGHGAGIGRITSVGDPSAVGCAGPATSTTYDALGNITQQTKCILGNSYTFYFTYDQLGRLAAVKYPGGRQPHYTYNAAGNVSGLDGVVSQMIYDGSGRVHEMDLANNVTETYTYDPQRNWTTGINITGPNPASQPGAIPTPIFSASYGHLPNGLTSTSSSPGFPGQYYSYDSLKRLGTVEQEPSAITSSILNPPGQADDPRTATASATAQSQGLPSASAPIPSQSAPSTSSTRTVTEQYNYDDPTGNITYSSAVGTYIYGQTPRECTQSGPCAGPHAVERAGSRTFQYDLNGNLIQSEDLSTGVTRKITWNDDNRPVQFQSSDNKPAEQITYDANGTEVASRTTDTQSVQETTRYFGLAEQGEDGHLLSSYMLAGRWIASGDNVDRRYYHLDPLGSVRAVTDSHGKLTTWSLFSAYGTVKGISPPTPSDALRFAGHRIDITTGLINMDARWYDPGLSRFISPDTIIPDLTNPQTLNPYSYAQNNPTTRVDPNGHQDEVCTESIDPDLDLNSEISTPSSPPPSPTSPQDVFDPWAPQVTEVPTVPQGEIYDNMTVGEAIEHGVLGDPSWEPTTYRSVSRSQSFLPGEPLTLEGPSEQWILDQQLKKTFQRGMNEIAEAWSNALLFKTMLGIWEEISTLVATPGLPGEGIGIVDSESEVAAETEASVVNAADEAYPRVLDPRTGEPIPAPPSGLTKVPVGDRVPWGAQERGAYIKEWYDRGYSTPEGGWSQYDIHHIIPREYGGTNGFENLAPVLRTVHQQEFNTWWMNYGD